MSDSDLDDRVESFWKTPFIKPIESIKEPPKVRGPRVPGRRRKKAVYNISPRLFEYLVTSNLGRFEGRLQLHELLYLFKTSLAFKETLLYLLKLSHYINGGVCKEGTYNVSEKFLTFFTESLSCPTTRCTVDNRALKNVILENTTKASVEDMKGIDNLKHKILYDYKTAKAICIRYRDGVPITDM